MREIIFVFILSSLPFMQMASVLMNHVSRASKTTQVQPKVAPELPLNTLYYFIQ